MDDPVPSEKYQAKSNHIGPSEKTHKKHQATLQLIHEGHLGLGKCKLRAKDTVYWPGLNDQFEKLVLKCELCLKYSHSKCKQKLNTSLGQEIPVYP